jgi:hypothetical protein
MKKNAEERGSEERGQALNIKTDSNFDFNPIIAVILPREAGEPKEKGAAWARRWPNQIEIVFGIVGQRFVRRGNFAARSHWHYRSHLHQKGREDCFHGPIRWGS